MTISRRAFYGIFLICCIGILLVILTLERTAREEQNYSAIEDGLFMGGLVDHPPPGTQAVLNLCEHEDPYRCDTHRWEPIPDAAPAPDIDWLRRMVEMVATERQAGKTVYVHCFAGISRSGMVVTAYLMSEHHWSRDQALAFVRSKRPITKPNSGNRS